MRIVCNDIRHQTRQPQVKWEVMESLQSWCSRMAQLRIPLQIDRGNVALIGHSQDHRTTMVHLQKTSAPDPKRFSSAKMIFHKKLQGHNPKPPSYVWKYLSSVDIFSCPFNSFQLHWIRLEFPIPIRNVSSFSSAHALHVPPVQCSRTFSMSSWGEIINPHADSTLKMEIFMLKRMQWAHVAIDRDRRLKM